MKVRASVLWKIGAERPYAQSRPLATEHLDLEGPRAGEVLLAVRAAGLCHSDLSAVDGVRPGSGGLDAMLDRRRPGDEVVLHLFRRDELLALRVRLARSPRDTCMLSLEGARERAPLRRWLGGGAR